MWIRRPVTAVREIGWPWQQAGPLRAESLAADRPLASVAHRVVVPSDVEQVVLAPMAAE